MPALGGGDNVFGIRFPDEGCGPLVVVLDEAIDGLLQADLGVEGAAFESHKTLATTVRYAHLAPRHLEKAARLLQLVRSGARA